MLKTLKKHIVLFTVWFVLGIGAVSVIKLKDLLLEYSPHASEQFATDSKDGASKGLESKFKYFKRSLKNKVNIQKILGGNQRREF